MATKTIVIYPGGFHVFTPGHLFVYNYLIKKFPEAEVFVASSASVSERPFPFEDKKELAVAAGVPEDRFIQVKSPYKSEEILKNFNGHEDHLIFALSQKDAGRLTYLKKDGSPAYFREWKPDIKMTSFESHAYVIITPVKSYSILGKIITSAGAVRDIYKKASEEEKTQIIQELYPKGDVEKIRKIFDSVLHESYITEVIIKSKNGWTLFSKKKTQGKRKKLGGPYASRGQAIKREREVEYFKHLHEDQHSLRYEDWGWISPTGELHDGSTSKYKTHNDMIKGLINLETTPAIRRGWTRYLIGNRSVNFTTNLTENHLKTNLTIQKHIEEIVYKNSNKKLFVIDLEPTQDRSKYTYVEEETPDTFMKMFKIKLKTLNESFMMDEYYSFWGWIDPKDKFIFPTKEQKNNPRKVFAHLELLPQSYNSKEDTDTYESTYVTAFRDGYIRFFVQNYPNYSKLIVEGTGLEHRKYDDMVFKILQAFDKRDKSIFSLPAKPIKKVEVWNPITYKVYPFKFFGTTEESMKETVSVKNYLKEKDENDFEVPDKVKENAKEGLDLRKEFKRGGDPSAILMAKDLISNIELPKFKIKSMHSYFYRHKTKVKEGEGGHRPSSETIPSDEFIAWQLYGGNAGRDWAEGILSPKSKEKENIEEPKGEKE